MKSILCFKIFWILCVIQTQLETAPPHELKNIFQMLQELLVSDSHQSSVISDPSPIDFFIIVWSLLWSLLLTSVKSFTSGSGRPSAVSETQVCFWVRERPVRYVLIWYCCCCFCCNAHICHICGLNQRAKPTCRLFFYAGIIFLLTFLVDCHGTWQHHQFLCVLKG